MLRLVASLGHPAFEPLYLLVWASLKGGLGWALLHFATRFGVWGATFCLWLHPLGRNADSEWTRLAVFSLVQALATLFPPLARLASLMWLIDGVRGVCLLAGVTGPLLERVDALQLRAAVAVLFPGVRTQIWTSFLIPYVYEGGVGFRACLLHTLLFVVFTLTSQFVWVTSMLVLSQLLLVSTLLTSKNTQITLGALSLSLLVGRHAPWLLAYTCDVAVNGSIATRKLAPPAGPLGNFLYVGSCLLVTGASLLFWLDVSSE